MRKQIITTELVKDIEQIYNENCAMRQKIEEYSLIVDKLQTQVNELNAEVSQYENALISSVINGENTYFEAREYNKCNCIIL